jgi:DNA-binding IclR family transcriptional regulator
MPNETRPTGTQSIERSIHLLKLLATRGAFGWGLTDLARRSGLDKATVHRILGCLEHDRLVQRDPQEHRYFPGPMLVELGLSVSSYQPFLNEGHATIARLSQRTGGVSFLYLRSGFDFVVAGRVEHSAHRGMLNDVGYRRPMIMSAGGVAMLIALPKDSREAVVRRNLADLSDMGITRLDRFERMLQRSLELGYSANLEDVAAGINSFSVPVLDRSGMPLGSISVAGDPNQFPAKSGRKFADLLQLDATQLAAIAPGLATGRAHSAMVAAAAA